MRMASVRENYVSAWTGWPRGEEQTIPRNFPPGMFLKRVKASGGMRSSGFPEIQPHPKHETHTPDPRAYRGAFSNRL